MDRLPAETDVLHRRKTPVLFIFDRPVSPSVIRDAHRIEAAAKQGFFQVLIPAGRGAQEVAPHRDVDGIVDVMEVVVRHAETVVAGAERPVPVLVFRADAGIQFHQFVT